MIHKKGETFYNKNGDVMKCHIVGTMNDNGHILVVYKYFGTHKRWWHYVIEEVESFNNYFKVGLYSTKNLWENEKKPKKGKMKSEMQSEMQRPGLEIKKIMQCEKCGYTCLEEDCEVKRFGEYTQDGWIEWDDLVCPRCGEPIWETNRIRQITEVVNEKKNKGGKMSSKIQRTGLDAYIKSEPIEKALYATGAFTKYQCMLLAKGIIQYLEDFGVKEI